MTRTEPGDAPRHPPHGVDGRSAGSARGTDERSLGSVPGVEGRSAPGTEGGSARGTEEGPALGTDRTPRVVAARKLLRRGGRDRAGRFLVEGAQAVREALDAGPVHELFVTEAAASRNPELVDRARERGARIRIVTDKAAAGLSETVTPQGLVAVCDLLDVPLETALAGAPGFVTVCAGISDPGNLGTVIRVADAAGCDAVLLAGDTVDPHNGKAVRASTGSLFHLPLARDRDASAVVGACRAAGLTTLVADGRGELDLHDPDTTPILAGPVAWILGSEAHGTGPEVAAAADHRVRVPIHGRAESLNLATAAAICLYATVGARAGVAPHLAPARDGNRLGGSL